MFDLDDINIYIYIWNVRHFYIEKYKTVKVAWVLYGLGFIICGISVFGLFFLKSYRDALTIFFITFFLGEYIQLGGETIYEKKVNNIILYKRNMSIIKYTVWGIIITVLLIAGGIGVGYLIETNR